MLRFVAIFVVAFAGLGLSPAAAQNRTISCESTNGRYNECRSFFRAPVIVKQRSKSRCVRNRTWGYERGIIWVDRGCRAVFAEGARPRYRPRYDPRYDDRRYYDDDDSGIMIMPGDDLYGRRPGDRPPPCPFGGCRD